MDDLKTMNSRGFPSSLPPAFTNPNLDLYPFGPHPSYPEKSSWSKYKSFICTVIVILLLLGIGYLIYHFCYLKRQPTASTPAGLLQIPTANPSQTFGFPWNTDLSEATSNSTISSEQKTIPNPTVQDMTQKPNYNNLPMDDQLQVMRSILQKVYTEQKQQNKRIAKIESKMDIHPPHRPRPVGNHATS